MKKTKGIPFDTAKTKQAKQINAIATAAADLFSAKGYLETSMDEPTLPIQMDPPSSCMLLS